MTRSVTLSGTQVVNPKGLVGLESVVYGVEDMAISARFFDHFGLDALERGRRGQTFETVEGTTIQLREADDRVLPQAPEPGSTLREAIWGVESQQALDALAADLSRDRPLSTDADGTVHTVDPTGYAIGFSVTERRPIELPPVTPNAVGQAARLNARGRFHDRARPQHLGHVVWYAPDLEEALAFYTQRLGFWISDRLSRGVFLRCSSDHHNLFLVGRKRTGLNHVSFGVESLDEIMGGFDLLSREGWEPVWGPGRHFHGSSLFYYFACPAGGNIEYYADMDCILDQDAWEAVQAQTTMPEDFVGWGPRPGERYDPQRRREAELASTS